MIEAIGIAILSAVGTSAAVATTVGIAGVSLATIVGTTAILGGSLLISALTTPDTRQRVQAQQVATKQALPPRKRAYGTVMLAGPKIEEQSLNGRISVALYHVEGPIGGYLGYFLEDKRANLPEFSLGGFSGIAPYQNYVVLEGYLGTVDQAASGALMQFPQWTADDRLRGCAYSVMTAVAPPEKKYKNYFGSGRWPEHRVLIRASLVWNLNDPSQSEDPSTWKWSDNAALCIRDHLTHQTWGLKVPASVIDNASFAAKANLCNQPITNNNEEVYPRYYLGGAFDLTDEPADPLQGMLDAMDGYLYLTSEGKIGLGGGEYEPPDVSLVNPRIISIASLEVGSKKRASFNRLKTSFVSTFNDYQVTEGDPWEDLEGQALADEILEADFARPWVQNHNQLRRLAKIYTARQNPKYRISGMVLDRSGLPALFESTIHLRLDRYTIDAIFVISKAIASGDGSSCTFDMTSIDPTAFNFNSREEEGIEPARPGQTAIAAPPENPVDLEVSVERRAVSGDINATFLVLTADEPARQDLTLIGQYRQVGSTEWTAMNSDTDSRGRVISSVLVDGAEYEAQGAISSYGRAQQSAWLSTQPPTITAVADGTSTGAPDGFVVNGGAGEATGAFTAPNAPNYGSSRVFRSETPNFSDADSLTEPFYGAAGQTFNFTDANLSPGTYTYWVRAFNRSGFGDAASTAGPVTVVVV